MQHTTHVKLVIKLSFFRFHGKKNHSILFLLSFFSCSTSYNISFHHFSFPQFFFLSHYDSSRTRIIISFPSLSCFFSLFLISFLPLFHFLSLNIFECFNNLIQIIETIATPFASISDTSDNWSPFSSPYTISKCHVLKWCEFCKREREREENGIRAKRGFWEREKLLLHLSEKWRMTGRYLKRKWFLEERRKCCPLILFSLSYLLSFSLSSYSLLLSLSCLFSPAF